MSHETERFANAARHADILKELLDTKAPEGASQRVYRTRVMIRDAYTVVSLVQNLPGFQPPAGGSDVKLRVYVDTFCSLASATFTGQFSLDEVVAFCGLDMVDRADIIWQDETRYTSNLVVASVLQGLVVPER